QARDQRAIRLIRGRLFLYLSPSRVRILFAPRTLGLDVECSLRGKIIKRTTIVLQIKNAIAHLEIKIGAVQLAAMTQAGRKIPLRHLSKILALRSLRAFAFCACSGLHRSSTSR